MFKNIIVGVDAEEAGRDATALGTLLLEPDGRLTLAHVFPSGSSFWRGRDPALYVTERERATALVQHAAASVGVAVEIRVYGSSTVGRGLHELAEATDADLVVIGSSRRGLVHRVLVGDTIRAALNGAPCAIAIAPAGFAGHPVALREIGVGYDGSVESEHALAVGRALAARLGTKLSAFTAVPVPTYAAHGRSPLDGTPVTQLVDEARERLAALEGVEAHAAYGGPAEELALYSASLDLLVIGSRSYGPIGRLVHGSTAQELAHNARCPLLVLTRAARQREGEGAAGEAAEPVTVR